MRILHVCVCRCICACSHQSAWSNWSGPAETRTTGQVPLLPSPWSGLLIWKKKKQNRQTLSNSFNNTTILIPCRNPEIKPKYCSVMIQIWSLVLNPTIKLFPGGSYRDSEGFEHRHPAGYWCGPGTAGSSNRAVYRGRPESPALQRPAGGCQQQPEQQHTTCKSAVFQRCHHWWACCVGMRLPWAAKAETGRETGNCRPVHFQVIYGSCWSSQAPLFFVPQG